MGFIPGRDTEVLMDEFDLSPFFNQTDVNDQIDVGETTTYKKTSKTYIVTLKDGTVTFGGFWDGVADAIDEELHSFLGDNAGQVVSIGFEGLGVGEQVDMLLSKKTSYQKSSPVGGVSSISAACQASGGIEGGRGLHALSAETATGNSSSVDNSAATTNGGVAHLHATAVTGVGGDTLDPKVQHSVDDAVWVDLVTFTQLTTAVASQRVEVAGTVNRYLRSQWAKGGAGSPSYTFGIAFARR